MSKRLLGICLLAAILLNGIGYVYRSRLIYQVTPLLRRAGYDPFSVETRDVDILSGNLHLRGTLYRPQSAAWISYPGVVICHGGTPLGRRLALYVVMAEQLARRGYVVLTLSFRGFDDSEDPLRFETFADLDFVQDVSAAVTVLAEARGVDPAHLSVIGHSFGAGVAVMAGIRDPRVRSVVSMSPGRGTKQRFFGQDAPEPNYPSQRMSSDMQISPPIPPEIFDPHLKDYIAEAILDYPVHPPVLLIDGAQEYDEELLFLHDVYARMTEPKGYTTIPNADHYFGTLRDQDGTTDTVPYDDSIMTELVDVIAQWLK